MINNYKRGEHDTRPWGTWEVIDCGESFCVKRITVNAGGILSLQLHHFRNEHWIIVNGTATVTLGDSIIEKQAGEAVFIEKETKHRIQNKSTLPLTFIEIQTGENLDENDIIRYEDVYGRVK